MNKSILIYTLGILGTAVIFSLLLSHSSFAYSLMEGVDAAKGNGVPTALFTSSGIVTKVINIMLFIAGALAVIMIIFGGLRYVTSAGNSSNVTAAKNTVLYAIVGLVVAFLAYAVINFVLGTVMGSVGGGVNPTDV